MTTLTYEDLDVINGVFALAIDEAPQFGYRSYIRAWLRVGGALQEAEGIEPKPKYKLTREGE